MAVAVLPSEFARDTRLTALVSAPEAEKIARRASEAGLSVSAYLRDRALGSSAEPDEAAALRQIDALIDRIEANLDSAIADLTATMARMDRAG